MKPQRKIIIVIILSLCVIFTITACNVFDYIPIPGQRTDRGQSADHTPTQTPTPDISDSPTSQETPNITTPPNDTGDTNISGNFPFPFSTVDIYGNTVTEASLGNKELFFIHYWGTWCPPCIAELPNLAQVERDFDDRVGFLMLLDDFENKAGAIDLYNHHGFSGSSYSFTIDGWGTFGEHHEIMRMLDIEYVPTTIIIDPEGNMLEHLIGAFFDEYAVYLNAHLS